MPGHELVGVVEHCGDGVDPDLAGQLVTAHFYLFCGRCRTCLSEREPLCERLIGVIGVQRDGGLAQWVCLPARNLVALPGGIDPIDATVVPDAMATPVHVCHRAEVEPGTRVVVFGAGGGVGARMVQVARCFGGQVAAVDVQPEKLAFLHDHLGVAAVDGSDLARTQLPATWHGQADVVVDLVGTVASSTWALGVLGAGGRLVHLTTFPDVSVPLSPRDLVFRQVGLLGSRYASRSELLAAAGLLQHGAVEAVIGKRVDLAGVPALVERMATGAVLGRGVAVV